jgi:hypothetical protein
MKYLGRRALAYGYPMPILMIGTYNDSLLDKEFTLRVKLYKEALRKNK